MGFESGILFLTLLVGSLAVPAVLPDGGAITDYVAHPGAAGRIVGGSVAAPDSTPYMVALTDGWLFKELFCGGSLISASTVLTAAHCIEGVYKFGALSSDLRGVVGTTRWRTGGAQISFVRNVTHKHYVKATIKNDIGLLVTRTPVTLSQSVNVVPLGFEHIPGGVDAKAAGWGQMGQNDYSPDDLLELTVTTIEGEDCVRALSPNPVEPHIELCTLHSPDHGMCNGDSGSALVNLETGQQVGIVSWALPCARGFPDVFVRVSAYKDWLIEHVV